MGFYRFMESQHVKSTLAGCLRISSLNYYRLLEAVTGDSKIGDQEEGRSITSFDLSFSKDKAMPSEVRENLEAHGIYIGQGREESVSFSGNIIESWVDGYVLCFYAGDLDLGKAKLMSSTYDSCVLFKDPVLLAEHMYKFGVVDGMGKMSDYFKSPQCSMVDYGRKTVAACNDSPLKANVFLKGIQYSGQSEYRVFFEQKDDIVIALDSIFVRTELSDGEISVISQGEIVRGACPPEGNEDLNASFQCLVECLRAFANLTRAQVSSKKWVRPILVNYWILRRVYKSDRLDRVLTSKYTHVGAFGGIRYALEEYLEVLCKDFGFTFK